MNTFHVYVSCVVILSRLVTERGFKQTAIIFYRADMHANSLIMPHQMSKSSVHRRDVNLGGGILTHPLLPIAMTPCTGCSLGFPGGFKGKIQ